MYLFVGDVFFWGCDDLYSVSSKLLAFRWSQIHGDRDVGHRALITISVLVDRRC